jgi:hypothetical protein
VLGGGELSFVKKRQLQFLDKGRIGSETVRALLPHEPVLSRGARADTVPRVSRLDANRG